MSVSNDLTFPVFPDIKANHASELTEEEFIAWTHYSIEAEKIFDTIAEREAALVCEE